MKNITAEFEGVLITLNGTTVRLAEPHETITDSLESLCKSLLRRRIAEIGFAECPSEVANGVSTRSS